MAAWDQIKLSERQQRIADLLLEYDRCRPSGLPPLENVLPFEGERLAAVHAFWAAGQHGARPSVSVPRLVELYGVADRVGVIDRVRHGAMLLIRSYLSLHDAVESAEGG